MSKNSAGKVYFVLYLAVILELLIIIVERDEAEEHLRKREREAREIVQDMLAQMQIGRGDENLTSHITDEISLLSDEAIKISGIPYKKYRTYNIEVGVNDGNAAITLGSNRRDTLDRLQALKRLANVQNLDYEILYTSNTSSEIPPFQEQTAQNKTQMPSEWKRIAATSLTLDTNATETWQNPVYKAGEGMSEAARYAPAFAMTSAPNGVREPFAYNPTLTEEFTRLNNGKATKRFFSVQFEPRQSGWYKLRFFSKTNRIMGVGGDARTVEDISDETRISIGSMQLTVKKLKKVQQLLFRELESLHVPTLEQLAAARNDDEVQHFLAQVDSVKSAIQRERANNPTQARDLIRKVDVYADITKLITPNKSQYFAQNHGAMEINVRVTQPPVAIVQANIALPSEVNTFDKILPAFPFEAGPFYGDNFPHGELVGADGKTYKLNIERTGAVASAGNTPEATSTTSKGESMRFMARTLEPMRPGAYTARISHTSQGDTKTDTTIVRVFASQLKNRAMVDARLKNLFYGSTLIMNTIPDCDGRIPANQFRVYAALNNQPQTVFTSGLDAKVPLLATARSASVLVTWVSPYTNEEVELYPKTTGDMKQREPDINLSRASVTNLAGNTEELTIEVSGIIVSTPVIDVGGKRGAAELLDDVSLQQVSVDGVPMTVADSRLQETGTNDDGEKIFRAIFILHGVPSKKPVELAGAVNFTISTIARNPINGVRSIPTSSAQSLNFTYTTPAKKGSRK